MAITIKKTGIIKLILLIVCLYIYIYNPIFQYIGFGSIKLLLVFSIIYILLSNKVKLFYSKFYKEAFFSLIVISYSLLVWALIGPDGKGMIYRLIIWFLEGLIIPFFLIFGFKDCLKKYDAKNIIIIVGFIASIISLFLIINPTINYWVRTNLIRDPLDIYTNNEIFTRGFTIAEGSSFSYGIIQGIIIGFCLLKLRDNYLYIIPIITLFISIIFNARIGLSVVIIAVFLVLFTSKLKLKKIIVFTVISIGLIFIISRTSFVMNNMYTIEWGLKFFTETQELLSGNNGNNTYSTLFGRMFFFPEKNNEIIFGTGQNIFLNSLNTTDVGYIIQIFEGGIIYLTLLLFFLFFMYCRIAKINNDKYILNLFFIVILIANIKGQALFVSHGFFRLFTLYYVYQILINSHSLKKY